MKLSVIMPVYNEINTIEEIVRRVKSVKLQVDIGYGEQNGDVVALEREIIVVDDGSVDGTRALLEKMRGAPEMVVIFHEENQGKGGAVQTALRHASGDILIVQDADLEYDPRDYASMLQPILEGRTEAVYGSRFRGGPTKAMFFWHAMGNRFLTLMTNLLFDSILTDMETCYKMFTREVADQLRLTERGWGFDPEITAQILNRGYRIYEVPISYTGREFLEGKKISWKDGFTVLWTLLRCRVSRC
jgi:glycosyltransferase involved in cell wall biosynthesis